MGRDAEDAVVGQPERAPRMLRQPSEPPPALAHIGESPPMGSLRAIVAARGSVSRRSLRGWAARITGRSDRRLLLALAGATDALASHCDLVVDRLAAQEAFTADVADAYGQDLVHLRAEVARLRRSIPGPGNPGS